MWLTPKSTAPNDMIKSLCKITEFGLSLKSLKVSGISRQNHTRADAKA